MSYCPAKAEDLDIYRPYFDALRVEFLPRKFAEHFLRDTNLSSIAVSDHWRSMRHKPLQIFLRKMFADLKFEGKKKATNPTRTTGAILRESQEIGTGLVHRQQNLGDPDDNYGKRPRVNQFIGCKKKTAAEINDALDADDDPFVDVGEEDIYEKVAEAAGRRTPSVCTWNQLQPITMQNQLLPLSYGEDEKGYSPPRSTQVGHATGNTSGKSSLALLAFAVEISVPVPSSSGATIVPARADDISSAGDLTATLVDAHNLLLRKGPTFRIYIRWIRGQLVRTRGQVNPSFDDPESFVLQIQKGIIRANIGDISNYLNTSSPGCPSQEHLASA